MEHITFEYRAKRYTLTASPGKTPATPGPPAAPAEPAWHLTLGPTALTTLLRVEGEPSEAVQARAIAWIDAHPDLQDRDRIVLGGG